MSKPAFYKTPPRWHFLAALVGAIAIELAAVAAGNLVRNSKIPSVIGSGEEQPFEGVLIADEPEPTPPEDSPPRLPPPPDDTMEFVLPESTPPPRAVTAIQRKPIVQAQVSRIMKVSTSTRDIGSGKAEMIFSPPLGYPLEARRAKLTGSGRFLLRFDAGGDVRTVDVVQSTGSAILDQVSVGAMRQWRCRPGAYEAVYVPVTFTLHGAQL